MYKLKQVVFLFVCCLLVLSSCNLGSNQNNVDSTTADQEEIDVGESEGEESGEGEVDQEIDQEIDISKLIALIPTCEEGSFISPIDGARIICIPEGSFQMGGLDDDEAAEEDEFPLHEQGVSQFWIYETEVTNAMFKKFVEATGYTTTAEINGYSYTQADGEWIQVEGADWQHPQGLDSDISELEDNPVVNVSKSDASSYCLWSNNGYLPTEEEWEKAARGTALNLYPWGNDPATLDLANFDQSSEPGTMDVFELELGMSCYGLLHMSGNVAEWISQPYNSKYYQTGIVYEGDITENQVRGGSWLSSEDELRVSDRQPISMDIESADSVGFRCVLSLDSGDSGLLITGEGTDLSADEMDDQTDDEDGDEGDGDGEGDDGQGDDGQDGEDDIISVCEMTIPAIFHPEIISEGNLDRLNEYAYSGGSQSSDKGQTLMGLWEAEEFKLGIFIPGNHNNIKYSLMPCGTLYMHIYALINGQPSYDDWMTFQFFANTAITYAQDKSTFLFLGDDASAEENEDGSVTVIIPNATCENTETEAEAGAGDAYISGSGVESFEVNTLEDGTLELVINIGIDVYPDAFDAWNETLLGQFKNILGLSSSVNKSGDEVIGAYFTVILPAEASITQEDDTLTIQVNP